MRSGKRMLAGLASGALVLTGVAIATAPSASAAQTVAFVCEGNDTGINGSGGDAADPTTVQPNCTVVASPTAAAPIATSAFGAIFLGANNIEFGQATIEGPGTWASLPSATVNAGNGVITNGGKTLTLATNLWAAGASQAIVTVTAAGVSTVSLSGSTATLITQVNSTNTVPAGTLTVTGIGAQAGIVVSPAYTVLQSNTAALASVGAASVALVQVRDETGANVLITEDNVTLTAPSTGWADVNAVTAATATDCSADGTFQADAMVPLVDAADPYGLLAPTPACLAYTGGIGAGQGVWINVDPPLGFSGSATVGISVTSGTRSFTGSVTFTVSSPLAGAWTVAFDKTTYVPGELAELNVCARDLTGLPVPDGLGPLLTRALAAGSFNVQVTDVAGVATADASDLFGDGVNTYNGCVTGALYAPGTPMTLNASLTAGDNIVDLAGSMWASSAGGTTRTASAVIQGDVPPATKSIVIVGERGKGDNANRVYVEGTSTGLVGQAVTPHFRFPGQTGFTAGTGTRTVDAQGNFNWQRKTGKQIAVQFRDGEVRSNTVIISAR